MIPSLLNPAKEFDTSTKRAEVMSKIMNRMLLLFGNLAGRWENEKEYEDFKGYIEVMSREFAETCKQLGITATFIKGTKRPFGCIIKIEGFPYSAAISIKGWKQIKN